MESRAVFKHDCVFSVVTQLCVEIRGKLKLGCVFSVVTQPIVERRGALKLGFVFSLTVVTVFMLFFRFAAAYFL